MKTGKLVAWILGGAIAVWVLIAAFSFWHDAPARAYAKQQATSTPTVTQPSNDWSLFWWGYMWGGGFGHTNYTIYRDTSNSDYHASPQYQSTRPQPSSGSWGTNDSNPSTDSAKPASDGSWGSGWSWGSGDSGSWGSSNDSSWDSSDSGSWDVGDNGNSSWSSDDSGSWGGSSDSWSSDSSGSWGD